MTASRGKVALTPCLAPDREHADARALIDELNAEKGALQTRLAGQERDTSTLEARVTELLAALADATQSLEGSGARQAGDLHPRDCEEAAEVITALKQQLGRIPPLTGSPTLRWDPHVSARSPLPCSPGAGRLHHPRGGQ